MNNLSLKSKPTNRNVFIVCLLSFSILITPMAALAAHSQRSEVRGQRPVQESGLGSQGPAKAVANETFVNPAPPVPFVPSIAASLTYSIQNDDGDSKIDPNDGTGTAEKIVYSAKITNSGTDATGVEYLQNIDPHTTLVPGSLNASPLAGDDSYDTIANTLLEVGPVASPVDTAKVTVTGNVLSNDSEYLGDSFTLTKLQAVSFSGPNATAATAQSGSVTMDSTGKFSYTPNAGFTGDDTFTYTISDDGADAIAANADDLTSVGTVTIHVKSPKVWYVKNSGGAGNGTSTSPFNTLSAAQAASGAGDTIFVFTGDGTTSGQNAGITLNKSNLSFIGEGVALTVPTSVNGGGPTTTLRPAGTKPQITNTAGNAVTIPGTNPSPSFTGITITGFNIVSGGGSYTNGIASTFDTGTGGVTIINNTIAGGTQNAIDVTTTATTTGGCAATITSNTISAAGLEGIDINGQGSSGITLDLQSNAVTSTGNGIDINGLSGGTLFIKGFANNAVSGNAAASGIIVNGATFDANPATGTLDQVSGGTTTIGSVGNGVGAEGLDLGVVKGRLSFTDLDIVTSNGAGLKVSGAFGAFTGSAGTEIDVQSGVSTIDATGGPAVDISGSPTIDLQFSSIKSAGSPTSGVSLAGVTGTFSAPSGSTIATATGDDFVINGSAASASFTYGGTITNTAGHSVNVSALGANATATFSGGITDSGTGILLSSNNATSTVTFSSGTLNIDTTTSVGFTATGGGIVNVTGSNNSLNSVSAAALNVTNTTIGASGLTFHDISSGNNTAAADAANGIVLNNTGSSGGLTVTGDGGSTNNSSGGTIQFTTGDGISLTNTQNVSLDQLNIQSTGNSGINGTLVTNFSLTNSTINLSGDAGFESNVSFNTNPGTANNIAGTLTITGNTLNNARYSGVDIQAGAGTVTNANISNNSFTSDTSVAVSNGFGININGVGTASTVFNLNNATISNNTIANFPTASGIQINGGNANAGGQGATIGIPGDAGHLISITTNTIHGFSNANRMGGSAIIVAVSGANNTNASTRSRANINISNNGTVGSPITNVAGTVIGVGCNGHTTMTSTIANNFIVANHQANLGGGFGIGGGSGVGGAGTAWVPALTETVTGNSISQTDGEGIEIVNRATNGSLDLKITGNTVGAPINAGGTARQGIRVESGNNTAGEDTTVCLTISGNTSLGSNGAAGIGIRKQGTTVGLDDFGITGLSPTPATGAQAAAFVAGNNTGGCDNVSGSNFISCATAPPLLLASGGVESGTKLFLNDPGSRELMAGCNLTTPTVAVTQPELDMLVDAAKNRWATTGLTTEQIAALNEMRFELGDLTGGYLGETDGNTIRLDRRAGGKGWFVDATPTDDAEFGNVISVTRRYTESTSAPAGRIDLLTAIEHEMGHKLGLSDRYSQGDRDDLMYGYLTVGERRSVASGEARAASTVTTVNRHYLLLADEDQPSAGFTVGGEVRAPNATPAPGLISRATDLMATGIGALVATVEPKAYAAENTDARNAKSGSGNAKLATSGNAAVPFVSDVDVTIGNLPAGKSVTIVFKVTLNNPPNVVNNPYPAGGPQVSTQGTAHSTTPSFADVLTDNVEPPAGPKDATVTPVDLFNTTTNVVTSGSPSVFGDSVTFTATVAYTAAGSPSATPPGTPPTGNVQFKDGVTNITCDEGAGARPLNGSGVAVCTTSALTAATHTINADYNGDGNFDTSTGNVQQVVDACSNPSIVTKTADDGSAGTLRYAISHACIGGSVVFQIPNADPGHSGGFNTITLNGTELSINRNQTITGPNNIAGNLDPIVITGNNASRVFNVNSGKIATISGVTISNGKVLGANKGGGVLNSGTLTLTNVTLNGNSSDAAGGGVFNTGNLTVTNSTVSGNTGKDGGGGIEQNDLAAVAVLTNSTVSGNNAPNGGGAGVENSNGTFTIANVTVSGNSSLNTGGGVYNGGTLSLLNCTISGNFSKDDGGGMEDSTPSGSGGNSTIVNCTITNNHADNDDSAGGTGGGIKFGGDPIALHNTIVAGNFRGSGTAVADDLQGNTVDTANSTNNLIGTGGSAGLTNNVNGNQVGVADAGLGTLQNNGGPTQTHALLSTSTAIEAGTDVTTLNGGVDNVTATVVVANATTIPAGVGFLIQIDNEQMSVTAKATNTLTVARAANGTTAAAHSNGAAVNPAFDQRGSGFPRKADSADANTTQTVDIGAYEAHPTVEDIADTSTNEDTAKAVIFHLGDDTGTLITGAGGSVTASSTNTTLVPNANLSFTGSGGSRTLNTNPAADKNGTTTITVTVTATNGRVATDQFVLTVIPVADTPTVTNASTTVNLQTSSGLVLNRNANDGAETDNFKITNIQNGTLFKFDGTTQINNNDFITFAEGNAGLKFTPALNSTTSGTFVVQGSNDNVGTGLSAGTATATITVTKNNSNTAVTSSSNPSYLNQSVTFTATVTSATAYVGPPTGTVDFFNNGSITPITGCSARPLNGSAVATCTTSALPLGNNTITTTYNGDLAFNTSNGSLNTNPQVVNPTLALVVNTTDDTPDVNIGNGICADVNGKCSLRAAIQETNSAVSDDTITFNIPPADPGFNNVTGIYTITLGSSLPDVTGNLTITGPGPKAVTVTISGNNLYRPLGVTTGGVNLTLNMLAFTAGKVGGGQNAAAIEFNTAGTLTLNDCEVFGNTDIGSIALYANGSAGVVINRSTFRGNVTGMLVEAVPTFTVNNSTISNNGANGIYNLSTTLVVTNSTIANNTRGIFNNASNHAVAATLGNTLLSNNNTESLKRIGANTNTFTSNGHNLIDDNSGSEFTAPGAGDLLGTSVVAGIAALADNGGPTQTRALQSNSGAIDAGDNTLATNAGLTTDQRSTGFTRAVDGPDADTTATVDIGAFEAQVSLENITDKLTNEDTQLQFTFNVNDGISSANVTGTSSNTTIVPNANILVTGASSPLTLTINPAADKNTFVSGPITITVTVTNGGNVMTDTFLLTVTPIGDAPTVAPATTNEDVQTSAIGITKNVADGSEVAFFKITNILNGTLFKNDLTPLSNGSVITEAEGNLGLKFTPAPNFFGTGHFDVQGATAVDGSGAGAATTANITVNAVADTPSVSGTTVNEDGQSTTGLVVSRNPNDGAEVTHFKVTGITGGTLFQNNGTTQINNGDFIDFATANAGLKFTPTPDTCTPCTPATTFGFTIGASTSNTDAGLGGGPAPAPITVSPIGDTPSVTNSITNEDTQTTSGLVISRNAVDNSEIGFFKITNITNGTLFKNNGTTQINNGDFITVAEGANVGGAGLKFTPALNFSGFGSFQVFASVDNIGTGLSANFATATINVGSVADVPTITPTTTNEDTQSSTGLVITKNVNDGPDVTHFKITNITNGTLFKNNGSTQINNGDFITVAEGSNVGGAGLKFTPSTNLYSPGTAFTFNAAGATSAGGAGLGNTTAASITVNAVADSPSVSPNPQNTAISTQTGPMVISRNAADGAEVTNFKITNITNGMLFQNNGTTVINNNDFIDFATANAGLKFTPTAGLSSPGNNFGFDVQASLNNTNGGLGPDPAVHENILVSCSDPQVVTKTIDDGSAGTLRYAIANSCPATGVITFNLPAGPQTITLGSTLTITKTLSIIGPTNQAVTVNGGGNRVLNVTGGSPSISSLTFNGALVSGGNGGGLLNTSTGAITFNGVTFSGNSADGGGAIATTAGTIVINNSTISGNSGPINGGGGIYNNGGTITLLNDTITNNNTPVSGSGVRNVAGTMNVKNTIIAGNSGPGANDVAGTINDQGNNILTGNPQLAALANNGGPTMTHALLSNSPALDAGDNAAAAALATDQRGNPFGRLRDAANDADTTQTVDIGAFEADPSIEDIQDKTTLEDTALPTFSFRVADSFSAFDSIVGTSNNLTLVPNANIVISGSGNSRNIDITPAANQFGTATITVTATKTINSTAVSMSDTFVLTVGTVGDTPNATNASTSEDVQTTSGLVITRNAADGAEIQNFKITNIIGGTLFKNDGVTMINNNDFITVAEGGAGLKFTPAPNSFATGSFQVQSSRDNIGTGLSTGAATATIAVTATADTPSVTNATTNEDVQSTSGLVISRNGVDGAEVTHFQITGITNGTLFQTNGTTQINNGDFITAAQGGGAGLKFTPAGNLNTAAGDTFSFQVRAATDNAGGGLSAGSATATITVNAVNDVPSFTKGANQTVDEDAAAQTVNGWATALSAGPANESTQLLDFIVTNDNNTLFSAQPAVSSTGTLTFTPAAIANGTAIVSVKIHDNGGTTNSGVDTSAIQTFTVTVNAVNDVPSFTKGADQTVLANSGAQTVNGWATALSAGPANESGQALDFIVSNNNNTLFSGQPAVSAAGVLTYTPATNQTGTAIVSVRIHDNGGTAFSGVDTSAVQTFNITVNKSGTTTNLGSSNNPSFTNQLVTFTATVTSNTAVPGPPTGTVQFFDGVTPLNCSNGNTSTQTLDGTGKATCQTSALTTAGSPHAINATYSGDGAYNGSSSNTVSQVITPPLALTVNDTGDTGDAILNGVCADSNGKCTLRAAIQEANFAASDDTINFSLPANSTINLLTALPTIDGNVTINGSGANTLTVQRSTAGGTPAFRVFEINPARTVNISGLTISNGNGGSDGAGGILNRGTLTLSAVTVSGNSSTGGGAGILNTGTLTVNASTISGNTDISNGGGIFNVSGGAVASVTINNSTISGNTAQGGGAITNLGAGGVATLTLTNVTMSNNTTVSNTGGGGISAGGLGTITLQNTIVAGNFMDLGGNPQPDDIHGSVDGTSSFNVIGTGGSGGLTNGVNNNLVGVDARLAALANNGGTTQTMALLSGSPALDAGSNTLATNAGLTTDQRGAGFARFIDGPDADATATVDIGAFEAQPSIEDILDKSTNEDTALPTFNFTVASGAVSNFTVTATSSNTTLVPNGNLNLGGAGSTRSLSITPTADQNGTTIVSVTAAGTIGTTSVSMTDTFVLTVNAANDAPTFALNAGPVVNEDSGPQSISNQAVNISAGPANETGQTFAFTVTNNNNGLFSAQPAISPAGTLTFTSAPDANGSAIVSVTLKDNGGTANGGQDTSVTQQFTITVNAVNDAPVNTVPGSQQVTENSTLTFSLANTNAISIADVDAGGGTMRETLSATNGVITLGSVAGLSFTVGNGNGNPTMTFTGTVASVNAALQGMKFAPTSGFSGAATLTIVTNDQGNTGSGGALSDTDVVNITVNDGGTLQFSGSTYTIGENNGPGVVTITRTGGSAGTATVQIATSNGTATAGSDYTAVSQTVTFNDGEISKTVNIPITNDLINEPDETVNLTLSNAGGSGALGTPATAALTITNDDPTGGYIQFSTTNYNVNEGGVATITVQRVGTLTEAVTVDFATTDSSDPALMVPCAPTPGNTLATSRCDFDSTFGRLSWAAGDGADKTFTVMTTQDNYVEGPESLTLTLFNLSNSAAFIGSSTSILTINDDAVEPAGNAIDDSGNFVEQLYRDFLNRPSDPAGKAFWVDNIEKCNDPARRPANLTVAQCKQFYRVATAGAFFLSIEFQVTGGTAYLTNKATFGSIPSFARFERDALQLGQGYVFLAPGAEAVLEANRVAYYNDFVTRLEFVNTYGGISNQQFVDTLITNTGVSFTPGERNQLLNGLNNGTETRATVLRKITEKPAFRAAEFNSIFVVMEYFGFLRRNSDQPGFIFWLAKLNQFNGDFTAAEMVKAFIESNEYRQRFGQ